MFLSSGITFHPLGIRNPANTKNQRHCCQCPVSQSECKFIRYLRGGNETTTALNLGIKPTP
jgi:hypothetical protein